jgi:putative phosphoribosyl transferase
MIFEDRVDAGRQLAKRLGGFAHRADVVVLGVPRGGVVVAFEVAAALGAPLDVFLSRKLGVPGQTELAFGAVSASGGRYLDEYMLRTTGITNAQVEWITAEVRKELDRRASVYRGDRPQLDVLGRTVILIDDGVATGASVYAAIQALRQMQPARLVLAVPVAPASAWEWLRTVVDRSRLRRSEGSTEISPRWKTRRWLACWNAPGPSRRTADRAARATRLAVLGLVRFEISDSRSFYFEAWRAPAAFASASVINLPFLVVPYSLSPEPW